MKTKSVRRALALLLLSTLNSQLSTCSAQGTAFTYQGRLNSGINVANGSYDLTFALFNVVSGAGQVGNTVTNAATAVSNGLFTVAIDFGANFPGADRWLEIAVRTNGGGSFTNLAPRQPLTPTPYAIFAAGAKAAGLTGTLPAASFSGTYGNAVAMNNANNSFSGAFSGNGANLTNVNAATLGGLAASSFWQLGGNSGTTPGAQFLGTTDNQPLELQVNGIRALRIEPHGAAAPSLAGGYYANSVAGFSGAVVAGGGTSAAANGVLGNYAFIGAGYGGNAGSHSAVVAGAYNNSPVVFGFIGTGLSNTNLSDYSFIGDGSNNLIQANSTGSFIGGGILNVIQNNAGSSTIMGGYANLVQSNFLYGTIGGGLSNTVSGYWATIGGGYGNTTVGGNGTYSTVGGGNGNTSSGYEATVGGGSGNISSGYAATVGGGDLNTNTSFWGTIGGGSGNNTIYGNYATVGGGAANTSGNFATVPGGYLNSALGASSFAAGRQAKANHQGSFVWADSQAADFASTANDQFLIRAGGGVGIGVNSPQQQLSVGAGMNVDQNDANAGTVTNTLRFGSGSGEAIGSKRTSGGNRWGLDFYAGGINRMSIANNGNVSIASPGSLSFGSQTRQMLNLWDTRYGIGVQAATLYFRCDTNAIGSPFGGFRWYQGGVHNDANGNAGAGGTELMSLGSSYLYVNGTFVSSSDRNVKENFEEIKPAEVLAKVAALPITSWNYKQDATSRHLGPMAQDFYAAFGVGPDDKHITVVDESGVALAAIQGLNEKVEEKDKRIAELETRLEKLERLMNQNNGGAK